MESRLAAKYTLEKILQMRREEKKTLCRSSERLIPGHVVEMCEPKAAHCPWGACDPVSVCRSGFFRKVYPSCDLLNSSCDDPKCIRKEYGVRQGTGTTREPMEKGAEPAKAAYWAACCAVCH